MRIATLLGSAERETEVLARLAADPAVEVAFRCMDRPDALAMIRAGGLDAALAVGPTAWFDFQCVEEAHRSGVRLLGLAADPIEAEALEVGGFHVLGDLSSLAAEVATRAPEPPAHSDEASGRCVAVWGPKGAPGRTTVAIELATVLALSGSSTLLIDADLYGGDVAQLLGVVDELPGVVQLCRMGARGELRDSEWVQGLRTVPGGAALIPGLLRAELWADVSTFGWAELTKAARQTFDTTVVDLGFCLEPARAFVEGPGRNDVALSCLEGADQIVAVLRADPVGVRHFLWSVTDHREMLDPDRLRVVVNRVRAGEKTEITRFMRRHLGRAPLAVISDRPDHLSRATWQGLPVVMCEPSSPVSEAVRELAGALGATVPPRGFLARLAGRSGRV